MAFDFSVSKDIGGASVARIDGEFAEGYPAGKTGKAPETPIRQAQPHAHAPPGKQVDFRRRVTDPDTET